MRYLRAALAAWTLAICLAWCGVSWGATYYVATTGNDTTGDGSSGNPWKTLTKAEATAANTDTVHIAAGTYPEDDSTFHCWYTQKAINWAADGEVIVRAATSTSYVLVSAGTTAATTYTGIIFDGQGTVTDLVYNNTNSANKTFTSCNWINPKAATGHMHRTNTGVTGLTFTNCTFNDGGTNMAHALEWYAAGAITVTGGTVTLSGTGKFAYIYDAGTGTITFDGLKLTDTATASTGAIILATAGTRTINIKNCTFDVRGATQNQPIILLTNQSAPVVEGNTFETIHTAAGGALHIQVQSTGLDANNPIIKNNICRTTSASTQCILVGTDSTGAGDGFIDNALIEGNQIYGPFYYDRTLGTCSLHGIEYGFNGPGTVRRNYVNGCAYGIVIKDGNLDYGNAGGVYENVLIDNAGTGNVASSFLRIKGSDNVPVYKNTFYLSSNYSVINGLLHISQGDDAAHDSNGTKIRENLFYGKDGVNLIQVDNDGSTITATEVDGNLYWNNAGSNMDYAVGATTYANFAAWQAAGYDVNGKSANPGFSSLTRFTLRQDSPCVQNGYVAIGAPVWNKGGMIVIQ